MDALVREKALIVYLSGAISKGVTSYLYDLAKVEIIPTIK